jgi:hypothetical protein
MKMEDENFSKYVALLLAVLSAFTNALKAYTGVGRCPSLTLPHNVCVCVSVCQRKRFLCVQRKLHQNMFSFSCARGTCSSVCSDLKMRGKDICIDAHSFPCPFLRRWNDVCVPD